MRKKPQVLARFSRGVCISFLIREGKKKKEVNLYWEPKFKMANVGRQTPAFPSVSGRYRVYSMQKFTLLLNKTEAIKIKLFPEDDSGENMVSNRWCSQQPATVTFPESGCIKSQSWILPIPNFLY